MRKALHVLVAVAAVGSSPAYAADAQVGAPPAAAQPAESSDAVQPSQPAPQGLPPATPSGQAPAPPPPTANLPSAPAPAPPQPSAVAPATPEGQWVYTGQYGWVFMPYAQRYTYVPAQGTPYMYAYYPAFGWRWIVAPWVYGSGPRPYWGPGGRGHFAWNARPWFRFDGHVAHFHGRHHR